jgi:hypothetical protein
MTVGANGWPFDNLIPVLEKLGETSFTPMKGITQILRVITCAQTQFNFAALAAQSLFKIQLNCVL